MTKLSISQLIELQILSFNQQHFSVFSTIKRQCCVLKLLRKLHWNFESIFSKYVESCLHKICSKLLATIGKILTDLSFLDPFFKTCVRPWQNYFVFSEHTLKMSCAIRFICLKNIHAGYFFIIKCPYASKFKSWKIGN